MPDWLTKVAMWSEFYRIVLIGLTHTCPYCLIHSGLSVFCTLIVYLFAVPTIIMWKLKILNGCDTGFLFALLERWETMEDTCNQCYLPETPPKCRLWIKNCFLYRKSWVTGERRDSTWDKCRWKFVFKFEIEYIITYKIRSGCQ